MPILGKAVQTTGKFIKWRFEKESGKRKTDNIDRTKEYRKDESILRSALILI
jgi:hypothetical protein